MWTHCLYLRSLNPWAFKLFHKISDESGDGIHYNAQYECEQAVDKWCYQFLGSIGV